MKISGFILLTAAWFCGSCSVVFTGSLTGSVYDLDRYENDGSDQAGIDDLTIYLYEDETFWVEDLSAWKGGSGTLPDNPPGEDDRCFKDKSAPPDPRYFQKTVTDDAGSYALTGFIWKDLFPKFGKSGDRKEIFLLCYHKAYGLVKNPTPIYVVSDVTNQIPPLYIDRIMNQSRLSGQVEDVASEPGVENVNIRMYVPDSWAYDSSGNFTDAVWPDDASYTTVTGADGSYSRTIEFAQMPSHEENRESVKIRIVYSREQYIVDNDGTLVDQGEQASPVANYWDIDGDGEYREETERFYYQTDWIHNDQAATLDNVVMKQTKFSARIEGQIWDTEAVPNAVLNVEVRLFVNAVIDGGSIKRDDDSRNTIGPDLDFEADANYFTRSSKKMRPGYEVETPGYYEFPDVRWEDDDYVNTQSLHPMVLYAREESGDVGASAFKAIAPTGDNWVDVVLDNTVD